MAYKTLKQNNEDKLKVIKIRNSSHIIVTIVSGKSNTFCKLIGCT